MKKLSLSFIAVLALAVACTPSDDKKENNSKTTMENPLFTESPLDFQAPEFDKIKDEHFGPAFEEAIRQKLEEIDAIANNEEEATFENTLVALEKSGQMLTRVQGVFGILSSANTNDEIQAIEEEIAPKLAGLGDAIFLNDKLYARVKKVYEQKDDYEGEDLRLIEFYHQRFVLSGAELSAGDKEKMMALNEELATLQTKFSTMLVNGNQNGAYVTDNVENLDGLSEGAKATASEEAKGAGKEGQWLLAQQNTTQQPPLMSLTNRDVRQEIFNNSWIRNQKNDENDTRSTLIRIAEIRSEQANLLGYANYAEWNMQDQMAKDPKNVDDFFSHLVPAAVKTADLEAKELQKLIKAEGENFELKPWDWNFYAEKLRKEKFDLDEESIMPYLELYNVLENGVFFAANQLFGLTFEERTDLPVYNPDVRVYNVFDHDGSQIGLFYGDFFKRPGKGGGAWMDNMVPQSYLLGTKPVIYNVCNYTKPAEGQPALITWDNVETLFHEFGHALHGFFASQKYPSLSGTNTPRDFVELPSQINEHCATDKLIFENYAKHHETGEPMPAELFEKIQKAATFNQGYMFSELLAAACLDLEWHSYPYGTKVKDVDEFETKALKARGLYSETVPTRYRSSYFSHIWGGGYAAGYYAYLWTEMLDLDAYSWFEANGGLTRENGQRFRDMILSVGNSVDLADAYREFLGREPEIGPMLKNRGM